MKKLTFFLLALLCVFSFSLNAQDEASCNYAAVDWVGNESVNEYQGIYYVNVESYSPAGTSDDGYSANINVNGVSYPLINDGVDGNNIRWYYGISVAPGGTYNWSVTIETCGGGPAAVSGSYTFHMYGCTYNMGLNYSPSSTYDDGSCVFPDWALPVGCMDATADNYMVYATSEGPDTQCIYDGSWNGLFSSGPAGATPVDTGGASGPGCTLDEGTTNYNSNATSDDGSCILEDWALPVGCMDTLADNYMVYATNEGPWEMGIGDDPCIFDGSWNGLFSQPAPDMPGCMDLAACNYAPHYNVAMNESCVFAASGYDCAGACLADADADGVCDDFEVAGCTDATAFNYSSAATDDDGSCVAVVVGCLESDACNYDSLANTSATCEYPPANFDCDGNEYECADIDNGATDPYGDGCDAYTGTPSWCGNFNDNDFVSEEMCCACGGGGLGTMLVPGCTNQLADNYNPSANVSVDSLCTFSAGCTDPTAFNYNPLAGSDDGSCIAVVVGCMQSDACNYDSVANTSATCEFPPANFDCDGNEYACEDTNGSATDLYGDGCLPYCYDGYYNDNDFDELSMCCSCGGGNTYMIIKGCTNQFADNYDSLAIQDDGSCVVTAIIGCTDSIACNYVDSADTDNGSCSYPPLGSDCDGNLVSLTCGGSLNVESYVYGNNDSTSFSYIFDEGEIAQISISGATESCCDNVKVYDGTDSLITTLAGDFNEVVVSRDNGLRILFESDGSVSAQSPSSYSGNPSIGSSWSLDCAVQGCTDSNADNFDSLAVYNNGSCAYSCASSLAFAESVSSNTAGNAWHSFTMVDNGVAAVTLNAATAFNEFVTVTLFSDCGDTLVYSNLDSLVLDPGTYYLNVTQENIGDLDYSLSLSIAIPGCTDETVNNSSYNPNANVNDGSCLYIYGCMDVIAENYVDSANVEDNSCDYIYGCMDNTATNYSSFATSSEGVVCIYPECPDSDGELTIVTSLNGDSLSVGLTDVNNQVLIGVSSTVNDSTYVYDVCLSSSISYNIISQDFSYAGLSSGSYSLTSCDGLIDIVSGSLDSLPSEGLSFTIQSCSDYIFGCTDSTAINTDLAATVDDGSCQYIYGCTDSIACNYVDSATTDNGSCSFAAEGFDCDGNCLEGSPTDISVRMQSSSGAYDYTLVGYGGLWSLLNLSTGEPVDSAYLNNYLSDNFNGCLVDGCYEISGFSGYSGSYGFAYSLNDGDLIRPGDTGQGVIGVDYISIGEGSCDYINGCFDTLANNYDSLALVSVDSLCTYDYVIGCTDSLACNFDSLAEVDNSSCTYASVGFDCNGNCLSGSLVSFDMGSPYYGDGFYGSEYTVSTTAGEVVYQGPDDTGYWTSSSDQFCVSDGCYNVVVTSNGWDSNYTWSFGDGSGNTGTTVNNISIGTGCVTGCLDTLAENYDSLAHISSVDSCQYSVIAGCMDNLACNYDSAAALDNGSCSYPDSGYDCDGNCLGSLVSFDMGSPYYGDGFYGAEYTVSNFAGEVVYQGPDDTGYWTSSSDQFCVSDGCYNVVVTSNGWDSNYTWSFGDASGNTGETVNGVSIGTGCIIGCLDPVAENYNPDAESNDLDSCTYDFVLGCMDALACNYDVLADTSNASSCSYPALGQDCNGNLVPLDCDSDNSVSTYVSSYETNDFVVAEGEFATLNITGSHDSYYGDDVYVYNGAGNMLASFYYTSSYSDVIISDDNGISIEFDPSLYGGISASFYVSCAVQGCMDPDADNYNSAAVVDDGTCVTSCPDGEGSVAIIVIADTYVSQETSYSLTGDNGFSFSYDFTNDDNMDVITNEFCIPNGTNMSFVITDSNGDGLVPPSGYEIQVCEQSLTGQLQFTSSNSETHEFQVMCGDVYGCNDSTALNYDADVTVNDGSCDYPCLGLEAVVTHTGSSQFATEQSWYIMNTSTSQTIASGPNAADWGIGSQEVDELCLTEGAEYMLYMLDSQGDGWNSVGSGGSISIESPCGVLVENAEGTGSVSSETFTACVVNPCPAPDSWATTITGSNHTIVITSGSIVSLLDGNTLDHANVGVFFTDSLGNLVCAGSTQVSPGETAAIAAMGDDTTTPEVDGLVAGEEFVWMIADCNGNVFAASATYSPISVDAFVANGVSYVTAITEVSEGPSSQVIDLPNGWSMFSTYMIADDMDMSSVLAPIIDDVVIAKNNSGSAYLVEWNFNGVGSLLVGQGYQIKTEAAVSLEIAGAYATPEDHSVALSAGWNMIGYLRTESAAADAVLADIDSTGNLIIAKDYNGQAYLPEWNFNGIGTMNPGEGYQLKTNNADVLQFLSNDESYRMSTVEVIENNVSHFAKVVPTDNNMTVVIEDAAWDVLPSEGAEIAAFDKDGNQVGSAIYSSPATVIAVWGDDATSSSKDGLAVSEPVSFKVWNTNDVRDFTVSKWIEGSSSYQVDAINIASSIETHTIMTELNASERVLVRVVNVLGQEVNMDDEPFRGTVLFKVYDDGSVERYVR